MEIAQRARVLWNEPARRSFAVINATDNQPFAAYAYARIYVYARICISNARVGAPLTIPAP